MRKIALKSCSSPSDPRPFSFPTSLPTSIWIGSLIVTSVLNPFQSHHWSSKFMMRQEILTLLKADLERIRAEQEQLSVPTDASLPIHMRYFWPVWIGWKQAQIVTNSEYCNIVAMHGLIWCDQYEQLRRDVDCLQTAQRWLWFMLGAGVAFVVYQEVTKDG